MTYRKAELKPRLICLAPLPTVVPIFHGLGFLCQDSGLGPVLTRHFPGAPGPEVHPRTEEQASLGLPVRSPSGAGRLRAGLGPGWPTVGSQVLGKAAAWPFSKYIQNQPKGNPNCVSAGTPGAQALETLNIKHVGCLPSLVIKTLISYFTRDGQGGRSPL